MPRLGPARRKDLTQGGLQCSGPSAAGAASALGRGLMSGGACGWPGGYPGGAATQGASPCGGETKIPFEPPHSRDGASPRGWLALKKAWPSFLQRAEGPRLRVAGGEHRAVVRDPGL